MKKVSISQEYLVCALSRRGGLIKNSYEVSACMVSSCIFDLLLSDVVSIDGQKILVKKMLTKDLEYLKPLYEFLKKEGPVKIETVISKYMLLPSSKKMKQLVLSVGKSVEKQGYVKCSKKESFKMGEVFVPVLQKREKFIEDLTRKLLADDKIEDRAFVLVGLLSKSNLIEKYFTKNDILNIQWSDIEQNKLYKKIDYVVNYAVSMVVVVSNAGWLLVS